MSSSNPIKPRYLGGLSVLFWGWQCELTWFALPIAIVLEARYYLNRRWALTKTDFYRVADLTAIGLVAMVFFLFLNRQEYHFITTLLAWIPILLFPLVTVLAYSTTPRMSLDVLFYSLRRQREPVQQSWDMDYVYLGACLLAAGLNKESIYYFPVVVIIFACSLYQLRSPRFTKKTFVIGLCAILLAATAFHHGIRNTHLGIKKQTELWIANWISQRTDPLKTRTALGKVGQLKLSDSIAFRIKPSSGKPDFPSLLVEAVYNTSSGTEWEVFDPRFDTVKHEDDFTWGFSDTVSYPHPESKIYLEFDRDRSLIPVPSQLVELNELPATDVSMSTYGALQGIGLIPAPHYRVRYDNEPHLGDEPSPVDLIVPEEHRVAIHQVTDGQIPAAQAIPFVQDFFSDFRYTLFQKNIEITDDPLGHFLQTSKAGHCEYFASATTLLLRQLGIPSRYVVGYAITEWNDDMKMYIVRKRHAHAWASAYINGRWVPIDTTPQQWLAMEEDQSSVLQPLWDFLGNNQFLFELWFNDQKLEDYKNELYGIGFILALILIWRIATSEQVIIEREQTTDSSNWILPGRDSPFFRIEEQLSILGFRRGKGELMAEWLLRIERPELLPMLTSHNRWRFDPQGISIEEKKNLADHVKHWLDSEPIQKT
ncbi:MAG: transglutaminase domain-containing protein [Pseudomonadales bacterium]|nr:transglutaminase domain-containing protein [Pseudomonadales bacterium]